MTGDTAPDGVTIRKFKPSYESFGLVVSYLAATEPFSQFRAGSLTRAVRYQLSKGNHVCAYREDRLIGYCGWLHVTSEMGERWLRQDGTLTPVAEADADAAALTIVRVDEPALLLRIIRETRRLNTGRRVFFRRDYDGGVRKRQTVMNR